MKSPQGQMTGLSSAASSRPTPPPSHDSAITAAVEMWKQAGTRHWIPIVGESMEPLLREGDTVLVAHSEGRFRRGDVVVFRQKDGLVAHRVLRIAKVDDGHILFTKGDNLARFDAPVHVRDIVGRIVSIRRGGRSIDLDTPIRQVLGWLIAMVNWIVTAAFERGRVLKHLWFVRDEARG